ncbi:hypothetical protein P4C99_00105 [Pontiellaceae bacterium B1224]|nr:hypothetical protein [Pontiellaceae bacterium B1224]
MKCRTLYIFGCIILLSGCNTYQPLTAPKPVVDPSAAMEYLEPGLRPEILLFPEYLMMEGFELNQHGRVPETELIGAGLKTYLSLSDTRRRFMDQLDANGWETTKMEIEAHSFRLIAEKKLDVIEIRAVQGSGPTEIFMLYSPGSTAEPQTF